MDPKHPNYYPPYSPPERIADGVMHVIGVIGSICATRYLIDALPDDLAPLQRSSVWVYCIAMISAFIASALYHFTPFTTLRPIFRRFDHAAIFLKIAGTYTPLVIVIGDNFSSAVLALVWLLAISGMIWKIFFWETPNWKSTVLYLSLAWMSLIIAFPLTQYIPLSSIILIAVGGITYTVGVVFYRWDGLRFSVAIWHAFVLTASTCFFLAILYSERMAHAMH